MRRILQFFIKRTGFSKTEKSKHSLKRSAAELAGHCWPSKSEQCWPSESKRGETKVLKQTTLHKWSHSTVSKAQAALLAVLFLREHESCDLGIGDHIGWIGCFSIGGFPILLCTLLLLPSSWWVLLWRYKIVTQVMIFNVQLSQHTWMMLREMQPKDLAEINKRSLLMKKQSFLGL